MFPFPCSVSIKGLWHDIFCYHNIIISSKIHACRPLRYLFHEPIIGSQSLKLNFGLGKAV